MKQVKVLVTFRDKDNRAKVYTIGQELSFDDARADNLIARGLAELCETPVAVSELQKTRGRRKAKVANENLAEAVE